jgi:sigma-B regulation protein RsbU (phosphoserine phosphatase)
LRRETLPDTRFDDPGQVLTAINRAFPMDERNNRFITVWYGVYDVYVRELRYAAGGHPPALAVLPDALKPMSLGRHNLLLGLDPEMRYETESFLIPPRSRLYIFSDGAFEVQNPDGDILGEECLREMVMNLSGSAGDRLDSIIRSIRDYRGSDDFEDDVSLIAAEFI